MDKLILGLLLLMACTKPKKTMYCSSDCLKEEYCDLVCQKFVDCSNMDEEQWNFCFSSCNGKLSDAEWHGNQEDVFYTEELLLKLDCSKFNKQVLKGKE